LRSPMISKPAIRTITIQNTEKRLLVNFDAISVPSYLKRGYAASKKSKSPIRGFLCRRRDLNPHEHKAHCALNAARLPIPPLRLAP
jgi:hypothetical protein